MKVLLVEDSDTHSEIISSSMRSKLNAEVITAVDPFEAYVILKCINDIEVIILDYKLPFVDGDILIKKLKAERAYSKIPIIISSVEDKAFKCLQEGANEFLRKPYTPDELCNLVKLHTI